ncbi:NADPH-dependent F420 reductase [Nocardia fluminea]|uniref:NADPH-dependent F420 reductase n=1 Tax=Nocardia fluminea TaxID=134984 RepID=UPI003796C983
MRIGIIGAGAMAAALGRGWAAAGHEVRIGARSADAARALAAEINGHAATVGAAIAFADAVLFAVPVSALTELLGAHGDDLAGKIVIDCTNAFRPDESAPDGVTAFVLSEDAVAERIATAAPKAHVVKAFNLLAAEVWEGTDRVFDGVRLAVPICGDDAASVQTVARLAEDLALQPFTAGGLHRARYLEATSVFTVGLWFGGLDARGMLPPLSAAFAVADA